MENKTLENYRYFADKVGCTRYDPCPICYRCKIKASHLYEACSRCQVPYCGRHTEKIREKFIKRSNFRITVSDEVGQALKEMARRVGVND